MVCIPQSDYYAQLSRDTPDEHKSDCELSTMIQNKSWGTTKWMCFPKYTVMFKSSLNTQEPTLPHFKS